MLKTFHHCLGDRPT